MRTSSVRARLGTRIAPLFAGPLLAALSACPPPPERDADDEGQTATTGATVADAPTRDEAHKKAFERLMPLAEDALALADPTAASMVGRGAPASTPYDLGRRRELKLAVEAAKLEADQIDERALANEQVVMLRAIRFELNRLNDDLQRRPIHLIDPNRLVANTRRFLTEIEHSVLSGADEAPLENLAPVIFAAGRDLQSPATLMAASEPGLLQASVAARQLANEAQRVRASAPDSLREGAFGSALNDLATGAEAYASQLEAVELDEEPIEWSELGRPLRTGKLARLPVPWGPQALARTLAVEERINTPLPDLFAGVSSNLKRLESMRKGANVPASAGKPSKVTPERCQALVAELTSAVEAFPDLEAGALDCDATARWFGDTKATDAALTLFVADHAIIEPARRRIRTQQAGAIALLGGRAGPRAHLHLRRVMTLAPLGKPGALGLALDEAQAALCRTGAMLLAHAELSGVIANEFLAQECPGQEPAAWLAHGAGDPRGSLDGILLARIRDQPHEMVAMDRFWWVPVGLGPLLATPPGTPLEGQVPEGPKDLPPGWEARVEGDAPPAPAGGPSAPP